MIRYRLPANVVNSYVANLAHKQSALYNKHTGPKLGHRTGWCNVNCSFRMFTHFYSKLIQTAMYFSKQEVRH